MIYVKKTKEGKFLFRNSAGTYFTLTHAEINKIRILFFDIMWQEGFDQFYIDLLDQE